MRQILKQSYYQNYCSDHNQILHKTETTEYSPWAVQVKKNEKLQYLCNGLTNFDQIWHSDAPRPPGPRQQIKFRNFENPRWQWLPSSKIEKLQYLSNRLTNFDEIWHGHASLPSGPHKPQSYLLILLGRKFNSYDT